MRRSLEALSRVPLQRLEQGQCYEWWNRQWLRFGIVLLCLSLNGGCKRVDEPNPGPEEDVVTKNQLSADEARQALVEWLESLDFQKEVMKSPDGLGFLKAL